MADVGADVSRTEPAVCPGTSSISKTTTLPGVFCCLPRYRLSYTWQSAKEHTQQRAKRRSRYGTEANMPGPPSPGKRLSAVMDRCLNTIDFHGYENVKKESKTMKRIWIILIVIGLVGLFVSANLAEVKSLYPVSGLGMQVKTDVKAKRKYTIACIVKNSTNPYMVQQLAGVRKAAQDMGFEAITLAPAKQDSIEEQVRIVEDLLQKKIDALIIHPSDSNGIVPAVEKAVAAKVPVATIGTPANSNKVLFRTGVDYKETGVVIMQWVAEKMNGEGNLIILEGPPQADNAQRASARYHGCPEEISQDQGGCLTARAFSEGRRHAGDGEPAAEVHQSKGSHCRQ